MMPTKREEAAEKVIDEAALYDFARNCLPEEGDLVNQRKAKYLDALQDYVNACMREGERY